MTWKRALADRVHRCGSCGEWIKAGELVAKTRYSERCEPCGRKIEDPPAVIEEGAETSVPRGVKHQASLGFERNQMASTGELARQHVTRHIERRGRR